MLNLCTSENGGNSEHALQLLHNERLKVDKNPLVGYLNINNLRNKTFILREIIQYLNFDYFVLSDNNSQ